MLLSRRLFGTEEDMNTQEKEGGYDSWSDVYGHGFSVRLEKWPVQKFRDIVILQVDAANAGWIPAHAALARDDDELTTLVLGHTSERIENSVTPAKDRYSGG